MNKNILGDKLKSYRTRCFPEMGLRKVADKIGVSFAHINKIERGLQPSQQIIEILSKAYNLSSDEEFKLLVLAGRIYEHPVTKNFFDKHPQKLKEIGNYFRKIKK